MSNGLDPTADNIAKQMQLGGYQTALFGKWHLKRKPTGFDEFCVFHDQGEYFDPVMKTAENWIDDDKGKQGEVIKGFSTDIVTDKTIEWIRERDKEKPFIMFCHYKATHEPWDYPERLADMYENVEFPEPSNLMEFDSSSSGRTFKGQQLENMAYRWQTASKDFAAWWCQYPGLPFSVEGLDREEARKKTYQKLIKDYLRCGAAIDENIGQLLDALELEGIDENTIVIYVSDQGYFLGEHGFFDKRMMYEESLRMPFVIKYPKEIPAGSRNADIILNIDFAALLADYAQVAVPKKSQGRSFRNNLRGAIPEDWRKSMYYRYWTQQSIRPAHFGIRTQDYKLMFLYGDPLHTIGSEQESSLPAWEFYDLKNDPLEDFNQFNNPIYQSIIENLKSDLLKIKEEVGDADMGSEKMKSLIQSHF